MCTNIKKYKIQYHRSCNLQQFFQGRTPERKLKGEREMRKDEKITPTSNSQESTNLTKKLICNFYHENETICGAR